MNPAQRQSASGLLVSAYKSSGASMEALGAILEAAEGGDPVACRALAADAMRLALHLEAQGDARHSVLLELAQEFEARAAAH